MSPAVAGDQVFLGSCSGSVFAFGATDGKLQWTHPTAGDGTSAQFHGDAVVTDDLLVIGSDARPVAYLYAFERATGKVRWNLPFAGGVATEVHRFGDTILAAAVSGEVVAVDLASGEVLWQVDDPPEGAPGSRSGDPALAAGRFHVAWQPGVVDTLDDATGKRLWRSDVGSTFNTSAVVVGEQVLIGSLDGNLYRLRAVDGQPLDSISVNGAFYGDLIAADECLLALWAEGGADTSGGFAGPHVVACLDHESGEETWRYESAEEWSTQRPLVRDDEVILGIDGQLLALDLDDGSVHWQRPVTGLPRGLSASRGLLYVGTLAGPVLALQS